MDEAAEAVLSPDAEKSESQPEVSPSDESAERDEMDEPRDDERRWR